MKMIIEVDRGLITNITATEPVSIYIIDHDAAKEGDPDLEDMAAAFQPDQICDEEAIDLLVKNLIDEYKYTDKREDERV